MEDLPLYETLLTDPRTMAELGGPLPRDVLPSKLRGIVDGVQTGDAWYSVILTDDGEPAGTICVWQADDDGERYSEIGWMVLPTFQGRGLASGAVRAYVERAIAEHRWGTIHAHPGVTNAPSNAICRKSGFELVGEKDIDYMGRTLRCNHWVLDPLDGP